LEDNKIKLKILPHDVETYTKKGTILLDAIKDAGIPIDVSCGGQGVCGRCTVQVLEGKIQVEADTILTEIERKEGYCLACLALIEGDLTIKIPPAAAALDEQSVLEDECGDDISKKIEVGYWKVNPCVKRIHMKLPPPTLEDCISDLDRLKREIATNHNIPTEKVHCQINILTKLGNVLREKDWEITVTLIETPHWYEIIEIRPGNHLEHVYGLAIDVGTTSVVVFLIDLISGKKVNVESSYNKQAQCGDDVISRMVYSQKKDGLKTLQSLIIETINILIEKLLANSKVSVENIDVVSFAGNTTMTHLLLGMNPKSIRQDPYIPGATQFPIFRASDIGLKINPFALGYCLPCVSSYVGGDITAGVLRSEINKREGITLLIDIGTNGEIVLGNKDWMMAASCSAGPAFEGGGVKNGMRATTGGIEKVKANGDEPICVTIGGKKPCGICGSGIIDAVSFLFFQGIIDRNGKIKTDIENKRVREIEGIPEYILVYAENTEEGVGDIVLTESDIDNIIRAKGAIYAGFSVLLNEVCLSFNEIERFLIAGGLGNYLNIESAISIGLLPDIDVSKFHYIGNSSVMGAQLALLSKELMDESKEIANSLTNLELSVKPEFMDEYMQALFLPNTNMNAFPSVQKILKELEREKADNS